MENHISVLRNAMPVLVLILFSLAGRLHAGSATWQSAPSTGNWNNASNWTAGGPPSDSTDTATFGVSSQTGISISSNTTVGSIVFNSGASAYTITATADFKIIVSGTGVTNNSGINQSFVAGGSPISGPYYGSIQFVNNSSSGGGSFTNNSGLISGAYGGYTVFYDNSKAVSSNVTNNGSAVSGAFGGITLFADTSTAVSGTFTNQGGAVSGGNGGGTNFYASSNAGSAMFTNAGGAVSGAYGGFTVFLDSSTAGSSTLIANGGPMGTGTGGSIYFTGSSTGGTARVEVFGNGILDISLHSALGVTIGSLEGNGNVSLGENNLTVGSNGMSTLFSGVITSSTNTGSLTKSGTGTLTLSGTASYTGATTVNAGVLAASNSIASTLITTASGATLNLLGGVSGTTAAITSNGVTNIGVSATLSSLTVGTSGAAVLIAHTGGAGNVKVLDISPLSIATSFGPGGEAADGNGLAVPAPVPEPGAIGLMLVGGAGVLACCRLKRRGRNKGCTLA